MRKSLNLLYLSFLKEYEILQMLTQEFYLITKWNCLGYLQLIQNCLFCKIKSKRHRKYAGTN